MAKKTIVVKQIASPARRPLNQRQTLIGLGLNKMHRIRELEDTPSVRGMVAKIPHWSRSSKSAAEASRPPSSTGTEDSPRVFPGRFRS